MDDLLHFGWCYLCNEMTSWTGAYSGGVENGEFRPHRCGGFSIPWPRGVQAYKRGIEEYGHGGVMAMGFVRDASVEWAAMNLHLRPEVAAIIGLFHGAPAYQVSAAVNALVQELEKVE